MKSLLCLALVAYLGADAPIAVRSDKDAGCQVILGPHVTSVVFVDEHGVQPVLKPAGQDVSLKAGRYRISEITLEGGYSYRAAYEQNVEWIILTPDKPYELQAGTPLTPRVRATRQGPLLKLDYQLVDAAGRNYRSSEPSKHPPRFSIRQQNREIASGDFEYG